jgi:hypothetical protein
VTFGIKNLYKQNCNEFLDLVRFLGGLVKASCIRFKERALSNYLFGMVLCLMFEVQG